MNKLQAEMYCLTKQERRTLRELRAALKRGALGFDKYKVAGLVSTIERLVQQATEVK